jgi:hypothetical protein
MENMLQAARLLSCAPGAVGARVLRFFFLEVQEEFMV